MLKLVKEVFMKYTKEERLDIAKKVVEHELTYSTASEQYSVSMPTIYLWIKEYKKMNNIVIDGRSGSSSSLSREKDMEALSSMSKDQLIDEVIKARIGEERAKKGYEVKGGGQNKEYVSLRNKNTK